tara:strand:- start:4436 stop:4978 length:543 start_codon:yes stop_codon:yes gene_type:complete
MNSINLIIILLLILSITYCLYHTDEVKINKSVTKQESINNESIKKSDELETSTILVDNKLESLEKEKENLEKKLSGLKEAENALKELQEKDDSCDCDRDDGLVPLNSTASLLDKFSEENVDTIIEGFDNYSQEYLLQVRKELEKALTKKIDELDATKEELRAAKELIKKLKNQISFVQGL